ncbi:hypothetical protein DMA15_00275 [Streptomyces sp. WAC 01529]|uniref:hypothetical protein n=1 Tax=Streptomyces sp. WAC 01529 TaxID=2203205 RepID=UPI000F6E8E25|nr:hypothetical protein [Streptomyces sp. WAC 01529]AZM51213.1 hypothetical protein DMA15_00275 [Streptomyces sp. WAC 01529]
MAHHDYAPDLLQTQREWTRTYQALAHAPASSNTALRRHLLDLSRYIAQTVPRAKQADLRRRAQGLS